MTPPASPHFIVERSYGITHLYPGTFASAMAVFDARRENIYKEIEEVRQARKSKDTYLVPTQKVLRALGEVTTLPVGTDTTHVRALLHGNSPRNREASDTRPQAPLTVEMRAEVALWAMDFNLALNELESNVGADTLRESDVLNRLSICSGLRERAGEKAILLVDAQILDQAEELELIVEQRWKPEAAEDRVIRRILSFVQEHLTHRDEKFELVALDESP